MNNELIQKIDKAINAMRSQVAKTTIDLVNIKSVKEDPLPGAPFGNGPRAVLDTVLKMGKDNGFSCTDYGVGVISLAMQPTEPDVGIWVHGDVVPEGDGWNFPPYDATEYQGCIIGRGATDNKGQLAALFHLLCIFKDLGVKLNYNPALYIGSNEETGMGDIIGVPGNDDAKGFMNVCKPPKLSLVPDGGFPVGYGGKGGMNITLKSKNPLHGWRIEAGLPASPGRAEAVLPISYSEPLPKCTVTTGEQTHIATETPPRHGSNPDPNGNMITHLSAALLDAALVPQEDRYVLEFFKAVSTDANGQYLTVATDSDCMKPLTVFTQRVEMNDGFATVTLNIRYPVGITFDEIVSRVGAVAEAAGFTVLSTHRGVDPYLLDRNTPVVSLLCEASNDVIGTNAEPFTVGGGTYAHRLPNAYVFGASGNLPPADFPEGRGGAHGVDEAVSLDRLQCAMRIYARALLALNDFSF